MMNGSPIPAIALLAAAAAIAPASRAEAALLWQWSYAGDAVSAAGTFTTGDAADADGYYGITAITGARNGVAITALQPAGTAIPGNEPFAVDNLVRLQGTQLTVEGFGYALSDGSYANPFYADFLSPPGYLEFHSVAPFDAGSVGMEDSELPIVFQAGIVGAVPEPAAAALAACGLAWMGLRAAVRRRHSAGRS